MLLLFLTDADLLRKARGWWSPGHGGTHAKRMPDPERGGHSTHPHGPFGPVFFEFRHNAAGAIEKLKRHQTGEAVAALYHPEVGDIDLVWGQTSDNPRAKGFGLAKLVRWHPEMLDNLQARLLAMKVHQKHGDVVHLRGGSLRGAIKLTYDQVQKHWLLTAYDKSPEGAPDRTPALSGAVAGEMNPAPSRDASRNSTIPRSLKKSSPIPLFFRVARD